MLGFVAILISLLYNPTQNIQPSTWDLVEPFILGCPPGADPLTAHVGPRPASAPRPAAAPPGSAPARTPTGSSG